MPALQYTLEYEKATNKKPQITRGNAAEYSTIKTAKYGDQINCAPFIVKTGGWINAAGLELFDKVSGALKGD